MGLTHKKTVEFSNGKVHLLETDDGFPVETTDTFLPLYTKDAIGNKQNALTSKDLGSRLERWMVGVSVMSGCPVHCKFCATGSLKKWRNLTSIEILEQITFVLSQNKGTLPSGSQEFKINYTRMGEPFLNLKAIKTLIPFLDRYTQGAKVHHYISTVGIKDSDFSWIKDNITLQISLHSLDEERRNTLIPYTNKMSIKELGQIRTQSNQKTTVNLTLVDDKDFDIDKLKEYFDPKYFFIKLSPINPNIISEKNNLGVGIIPQLNLV
jgi:23S rRNA (adenine2503-C2)-methyltransferase